MHFCLEGTSFLETKFRKPIKLLDQMTFSSDMTFIFQKSRSWFFTRHPAIIYDRKLIHFKGKKGDFALRGTHKPRGQFEGRGGRVDRVFKKWNVSEYNKTFNVQSSDKFKNFLLKKFFMIFQNGGDICSDIYVVKTRLFCPVCQVKF